MTDNIAIKWGGHYSKSRSGIKGKMDFHEIIDEARKLGWTFFQVFFGSKMSLTRNKLTAEDEKLSLEKLERYGMQFCTHFPYTFNMCKEEAPMHALQSELTRIAKLNGRVVVHPGSYTDGKYTNRDVCHLLGRDDLTQKQSEKLAIYERDWRIGADRIIANLQQLDIPDNVEYPLLLEPPAGEGKKMPYSLQQMAYIFEHAPQNIGLCLDTCHTFAAGLTRFDSAESTEIMFAEIDATLGIQRLKVIHLNDSKDTFGAMKDNHAPLTKGNIWDGEEKVDGLIRLWQLAREHGIDVVSEVASSVDDEIMKLLDQL